MMEAGSSKTKGSDAAEPAQVFIDVAEPVQVNIDRLEPPPPDLQTFDHAIHAGIRRVLIALADGVRVPTPVFAFDAVEELTGFHREMEVDAVQFIRKSREEILNNKELTSLVNEYLENSEQTLKFCGVLENCLNRARKNLLIIQLAVQKFEEEVQDGGEERKFRKTLDELNKFKAAEEPFDDEFVERFLSVRGQQVLLYQKLLQQMMVVDKKLKSAKRWKKVSNILFVTMFVSVVIFSVVAAAKKAEHSVAGTLVVPVGSLGKLFSWLSNHYQKKLEWQMLLLSMKNITGYITIEDIETIRMLVKNMVTKIEPLLDDANFALREQEAVKLVVDDMKKRKEEFVETINVLGEQADKCSKAVRRARSLILLKIEALSQAAAADSPWNQFFG